MTTIPRVMPATNPALQSVTEHGWRRGFANLLRNENRIVFAFRLNGIGTFGTEKIGQWAK